MTSKVTVDFRMNESAVYGLVTSDEARDVTKRCANAAEAMQTTLCPVDTGNLVGNIKQRDIADGVGIEVGVFDVDYARPVEEGHETEAGTWVPAQPFIRPSIDAAAAVLRGN